MSAPPEKKYPFAFLETPSLTSQTDKGFATVRGGKQTQIVSPERKEGQRRRFARCWRSASLGTTSNVMGRLCSMHANSSQLIPPR